MTPGQKIVEEAFAAYDVWCREWDPDSEMSIENQAANYSKWCALQDEIKRLRSIVTAPLSSEELRLIDKNCEWVAFGHAWNAVMKRRQEGLAVTSPSAQGTGAA